ncbi:MAG: hypothetical protein HOB70_00710 [Chloroflexi bacterium]|jgi:hypothetical protein|nr:hypothetical protein [Chloroflexota bacterium]
MNTQRHIVISDTTHAQLKQYCTEACLNMGAYVDKLIRNTIKKPSKADAEINPGKM